MEPTELDRLGESVKQIVEQLSQARHEGEQLREEKRALQQRLEQQMRETNRIAEAIPKVSVTPEMLNEISSRLVTLAQKLKTIEENI